MTDLLKIERITYSQGCGGRTFCAEHKPDRDRIERSLGMLVGPAGLPEASGASSVRLLDFTKTWAKKEASTQT